jgi:hypothetical protein
MRELPLSAEVLCKARDSDATKIFDSTLSFRKLFTFFSFVHFGKHIPVEKIRDEESQPLVESIQ